MTRPVTLEQAKARFPHRYTMEHIPSWARSTPADGKFYAPQFRTDAEWYAATLFHGESEKADIKHCYTANETWPLGQWLDEPYKRAKVAV